MFEFFAFYKNFSLRCCFAGLGLGYALADRRRIPLDLAIPLLRWQFGLMIALRFGVAEWQLQSLRILPFREQLNMGLPAARNLSQAMATYFFLSVIFLLTALVFIPIGQLCGRLMERREKLRAYGLNLNLLGGLVGVVLMLVLSWLWTPPLVWFALCFLGTLLFYLRKPLSLVLGVGFTLLACHPGLAGGAPMESDLFSVPAIGIVSGAARLDADTRRRALPTNGFTTLPAPTRTSTPTPSLNTSVTTMELPYRIYPGSALQNCLTPAFMDPR